MKKSILEHLTTTWAGKTCLCFPVLDSTNEYGKTLAKTGDVHGTLIVADCQSAGKGRRGRTWESPAGENIFMSLMLEPNLPVENAAGLTLVMALAVVDAVFELTGFRVLIKWPNDIVLNGKKICGILTELILKDDGYAVIIGTGINVNTNRFPEEIREVAGSVKIETGKEISRAQLIASVLKYFEKYYGQYQETQDLSLLKESYERNLANLNKEVQVLDPKGAYKGIAKGISSSGALLVLREDGEVRAVDSGEVSVRGFFGYV